MTVPCCGPKYSMCCLIVSVWGVIMLVSEFRFLLSFYTYYNLYQCLCKCISINIFHKKILFIVVAILFEIPNNL